MLVLRYLWEQLKSLDLENWGPCLRPHTLDSPHSDSPQAKPFSVGLKGHDYSELTSPFSDLLHFLFLGFQNFLSNGLSLLSAHRQASSPGLPSWEWTSLPSCNTPRPKEWPKKVAVWEENGWSLEIQAKMFIHVDLRSPLQYGVEEEWEEKEQIRDLCVYSCPGHAHVRSGPAVRHLVGNWICGSGAQEREMRFRSHQ